ncbi:hypothetical protein CCHR01_04962 [Colletotrichum chrysophilum]|uniref:Uncharacterized protein n=1 Tax=Colletotrichum chrysophilum TaxID=1836956 RepID=A0AAD9AQ82_9PEZI|nr:hypothetical protein CCHR01_04962 [Colletotrichum chrysophilum]
MSSAGRAFLVGISLPRHGPAYQHYEPTPGTLKEEKSVSIGVTEGPLGALGGSSEGDKTRESKGLARKREITRASPWGPGAAPRRHRGGPSLFVRISFSMSARILIGYPDAGRLLLVTDWCRAMFWSSVSKFFSIYFYFVLGERDRCQAVMG